MLNENTSNNLALDKQQYVIVNQEANNRTDVFELLAQLYAKRLIILIVTIFCSLLAFGITFFLKPQFQVKTYITKPSRDRYQSFFLNTNGKINDTILFTKFLKTLEKKNNYIQFIQDTGLLNHYLKNAQTATEKQRRHVLNQLAQNFSLNITNHAKLDISDTYKNDSLEAELITRSHTLDLTAKENLAYLEYTNKQIINQLSKTQRSITELAIISLQKRLNSEEKQTTQAREKEILLLKDTQSLAIATLNHKIKALKERDLRDKKSRLEELNNALQIAETLGIKVYNAPQEIKNHNLVIDVNSNKNDLYLRGTDYLRKEIALIQNTKYSIELKRALSALREQLYLAKKDQKLLALQNRTNDIPYIKNREKKLEELARLKAFTFDLSNVKSFNIIGAPIVETIPIKPNKKLIILIGATLGLFFSTMLVIIQNGLRARSQI